MNKTLKISIISLLSLCVMAGGAGVAQASITMGATSVVGSGVLTLTGNDVSVWSVATGGSAAKDLTVSVTGGGDSSLILSSSGTGADALALITTVADIDIDSASDITVDTAAGAITLTSVAGDIRLDATNKSIELEADEGANQIYLLAQGTIAGDAINLTTTDGGIILSAGNVANGDITVLAADDLDIDATAGTITIDTAGAGEDITLTATLGSVHAVSAESAANAVYLHASHAAGGVTIESGTGDINFTSTGNYVFAPAITKKVGVTVLASTATAGIIDLTVEAGIADGVSALDIGMTQKDGATATHDAIGLNMLLTQNDADGDMFGIKIVAAATANAAAASYEAGISITNSENTSASMTDAILITTAGAHATGITDAIDASETGIVNAMTFGDNAIDGTYFDIAETTGVVTLTQQAVGVTPLAFTGLANGTASLVDLDLLNNQGTIINMDYDTAEVQVEALTGLAMDLDTSLTALATKAVTGIDLTLNCDATTSPQTGLKITLTGDAATASSAIDIDGVLGAASYAIDLAGASGALADIILVNSETISNGTNGSIIFATDTANADTLILAPKTGGAGTFAGTITSADLTGNKTWTLPDTAGNVAILTSAQTTAGELKRADLTLESLGVYGIPMNTIKNDDGTTLVVAAAAGKFGIKSGGIGTGTLTLDGEAASGNAKTSTAMFEFILPPEYVGNEDVNLVVKAIESVGAATVATTISAEVYESDGEGGVSADLYNAFDNTDVANTWTTCTSVITDAALVPGDRLVVFIQIVANDAGGAIGTVAQIGKVELQLDIKG